MSDDRKKERLEHGDGLFRRVREFDMPEDIAGRIMAFAEYNAEGPFDYGEIMRSHRDYIRSIFTEKELEDPLRCAANKYGAYSREWYSAYICNLEKRKWDIIEGNVGIIAGYGEFDFGTLDEFTRLVISNSISFQLGMMAMEAEAKFKHEAAAQEGYRQQEGRMQGQPLAVKARRKEGEKRRRTILRLAREQIALDPSLAVNMTQLAKAILRTNDPGLLNRRGLPVSHDIVRKRLTEFRKDPNWWWKSP